MSIASGLTSAEGTSSVDGRMQVSPSQPLLLRCDLGPDFVAGSVPTTYLKTHSGAAVFPEAGLLADFSDNRARRAGGTRRARPPRYFMSEECPGNALEVGSMWTLAKLAAVPASPTPVAISLSLPGNVQMSPAAKTPGMFVCIV